MGDYMRLSDLQAKKIISITTGRNLGSIIDVNIGDDGKIELLLIEQGKNIFSLNRDNDTQILWEDISKIGEDVILVKK